MKRVERIRVERLRRAVVTVGCSFAVGALTALGLLWYDGGSRQDGGSTQQDPPYIQSGAAGQDQRSTDTSVGRVPNSEPTVTQPGEPQPTATVGPPTDALIAPDDRDLAMPVDGVDSDDLRDTFHETRAGTRPHEALDIMAPLGTPVRAVRDGRIEKLFTSNAGGLTIYQFEPTGEYAYYYAHLDRYAPGLMEGQAVARGDLIGFVGSTGNAAPDAPHLHFAIYRLGPERRWWEGQALNPYPLLK